MQGPGFEGYPGTSEAAGAKVGRRRGRERREEKEDPENEMQQTYSVRFCPSSLLPLHPAENDLDLVEPKEGTQGRRPTVSSGQT